MTPAAIALTRARVHDVLWTLTAKHAFRDRSEITPGTRLTHDLGADSLTLVEFTMELEEELGIANPDTSIENPDLTLAEIEDALCKQFLLGDASRPDNQTRAER